MNCLLLFLALCLLFVTVFASSGDRSAEFQVCVTGMELRVCDPASSTALPWSLRLFRWTCLDECKYTCMHILTDQATRSGTQIHQYYGKWPFWRLGGIQEPASVVFSLFNLWFHAQGARRVQRLIPTHHPMKRHYIAWALISCNAWVWSSVFHSRDLPTTEKLDYFSAALAILYALYYTVIRLFHFYTSVDIERSLSSAPKIGGSRYAIWSALCIIVYVLHVSYLTLLPRFDYAYNMAFNLTLGLTHNALWLLFSLPSSLSLMRRFPARSKSYRPGYVGKAAVFVGLTTAATALELFDFSPWGRVIDAHALWHLATAPIVPFWYSFLIEDALDDGWRGYKA